MGNERPVRFLIISARPEFGGWLRELITSAPQFAAERVRGMEVFQAMSPEEGLQVCASIHPDIVLFSIEGTFESGLAFCRTIRKRATRRHMGLIFIEKSRRRVSSKRVSACLEAGGDDYVMDEVSPRELLARIGAVRRTKLLSDQLRQANHRLKELARTDDLTGLLNMRGFRKKFVPLLARSEEQTSGVAVVMFDVDRFKLVNDQNDHLVGSEVLAHIGAYVNQSPYLPAGTLKARYGGDEYVLACPLGQWDETTTTQNLERLRDGIGKLRFHGRDGDVRVTASMGVALVPRVDFPISPEEIIRVADRMLYVSKEQGRDRSSFAVIQSPHDSTEELVPKLQKSG